MRKVLNNRNDRLRAAGFAGAINLVLGYLIFTGLRVPIAPVADEALKLFTLSDQPPPPPAVIPPPPEKSASETHKPKNPEGAAAPPARKNTPTEIVAPKVALPPTPIKAAPVAGQGSAAKVGAAAIDGSGTGLGGIGNGLGGGLSGTGNGGGGSGGADRGAVQVAGSIGDEDYPPAALNSRQQGVVRFAFVVQTDGRVGDCRVTRSSGSRALDATTCRLALQRFRFRPARDTTGRPVASEEQGEQEWQLGPEREIVDPGN
ncbi:MAG: TonB family protein [Sphingomicrobium sp.]